MSKGADTRQRILDRAFRLASRDGLEGLSIGGLADELGLSKSGLFAHFRSKEDLMIDVLRLASERFEELVLKPAFTAPRGGPRVKRLFDNWLHWMSDPAAPGGCLFCAAASELDDREGRPRDFLVSRQQQLRDTLAKAARLAVESGHFRADLDCEQFAFEWHAIMLGYNLQKRLFRHAGSEARARAAFARLVASAVSPS
jgi:AcrR family transcriptional regulator